MSKQREKKSEQKQLEVVVGNFKVLATRVELDFTFTATDRNVRALTSMTDYYVGLEEPAFGQKKVFPYEFSARGVVFGVGAKKKGKGKLTFDHNKIVIEGLYHAQETNNAHLIIYQTQQELPLDDEDGQQEAPEGQLPGTEQDEEPDEDDE